MTTSDSAWLRGYPEFGQLIRWHPAGEAIVIDEPIALGGDANSTAWAIALLRECSSWGLSVRWHGTIHQPFDTSALHYLPPPQMLDDQLPAAARWQQDHRYGSYHFRQGPEFIQVKDAREAIRGIRFLLSGTATVSAFTRCLKPARLTELSDAEQAEAKLLAADGLLLQVDGLVVTLPARLRRWPVPADAI